MKFLLVLFVAVAFLATGEALKCYVCTSILPGCDNPFDESADAVKAVTCPAVSRNCNKVTAKTGIISIVARGCASNLETCQESSDGGPNCYSCSTDLCNGVSATNAALSMLMVLAVPLVFGNYYGK